MPTRKSRPSSRQNNGVPMNTINENSKSKTRSKRTRAKKTVNIASNQPNTVNNLMKRLNKKATAKGRKAASKYKGMTVNGIIIHKAKEESNRIQRVQNEAVKGREAMMKRILDRVKKDKEKREKMKKKIFKTKTLPVKQNAEFKEEYERDQQNNLNQEEVKYSDNRHMAR